MTEAEKQAKNISTNKAYALIRVRREILKEIDFYAEWHNVDRQEALKMLLQNCDNLKDS